MDSNKIAYEDLNVAEDKAAREELVSKGFMVVPVIEIDGETIVGFDQAKIKEKLEI